MSGGHWEYKHFTIRDYLLEVGEDTELKVDMPTLAKEIKRLANVLEKIIHDLDYHYSSDTIINNFELFEKRALTKIHKNK